MPLAKDDEMVQALVADALDEPLRKCVQVRRLGRKPLHRSALA